MKLTDLNRPHIRGRIFGASLMVLGLGLAGYGVYSGDVEIFVMFGLGAFILGMMAVLLISQKVVPAELSQAMLEGTLENYKGMIESLNIKGKAMYVPVRDKNGKPKDVKLFLPLRDHPDTKVPELKDVEIFKTGVNDTDMGVALIPPGLSLIRRLETELGVFFDSVEPENLEQFLMSEVVVSNLISSLNIYFDEDRIRVTVGQSEHVSICKRESEVCSTVGCPVCSSLLCAICLSVNRTVVVKSAKWNGRKQQIVYELRMVD